MWMIVIFLGMRFVQEDLNMYSFLSKLVMVIMMMIEFVSGLLSNDSFLLFGVQIVCGNIMRVDVNGWVCVCVCIFVGMLLDDVEHVWLWMLYCQVVSLFIRRRRALFEDAGMMLSYSNNSGFKWFFVFIWFGMSVLTMT